MNHKTRVALLMTGLVSLQSGLAQDTIDNQNAEAVDETTVGRDRQWSLGIGIGWEYDDNIYRTPNNETDSHKIHIRPRFQWEGLQGPNRYTLNYQAEAGFFSENNDDNYFDQVLSAQAAFNPDVRHSFNIDGSITSSHDPFGLERTEGLERDDQDDPDKWYAWGIGGKYLFGAPEARGNLEFRGGYYRKEYTNNHEYTDFMDYQTFDLGSSFFYRVAPATRAVFSADYTDTSYDNRLDGSNDRDFQTYRLRAGVTWLATAKTSGEILGGYFWNDFDSREDNEGFDWRVNVNWLPRTYSTVTLTSGLSFVEGNTTETNTIETRDIGINWQHQWRDRVSSNVFADYINADHKGIDREDDIWSFGASVNYALGRNYNLNGGYRYTDRDSNDDAYDFSRNVFFLDFNAEF